MRLFAVILAILFLHLSANAQTVCGHQNYDVDESPNFDCPSPDEDSFIPELNPPPSIPVVEGTRVDVPWDGALVHRDRLIEVGLTIKAVRRLRWADRLRLSAENDIQLLYVNEVCEARIENARERVEVYQEALSEANSNTSSSSAWYRSFWFGFLSGTIVAGVLVALAAYLVTVL